MDKPGPVIRFLSRLVGIESEEAPAVAAGVLLFFLLFAGYFLLRPVRETMGIAGGVKNLQWLFTGTFIATLAAIPLFGWIAARVPRRRILPWTYGFFALNLLGFAVAIAARPIIPGSRVPSTSGCPCSTCWRSRWPGACWPICSR